MRSLLLAAALAAVLAGPPARAQAVIVQQVAQSHPVALADVAQLPPITLHIAFQTEHGPEQADYTGALLWTVLDRAGVLGTDPKARLTRELIVTGRDGYAVSLSLAELDPAFEGKQVLLAYVRDGKPMGKGELRLVVPGDQHGGRSVRDVVRIEIR